MISRRTRGGNVWKQRLTSAAFDVPVWDFSSCLSLRVVFQCFRCASLCVKARDTEGRCEGQRGFWVVDVMQRFGKHHPSRSDFSHKSLEFVCCVKKTKDSFTLITAIHFVLSAESFTFLIVYFSRVCAVTRRRRLFQRGVKRYFDSLWRCCFQPF